MKIKNIITPVVLILTSLIVILFVVFALIDNNHSSTASRQNIEMSDEGNERLDDEQDSISEQPYSYMFTEEGVSEEWRTYSNEKFGFSVMYPPSIKNVSENIISLSSQHILFSSTTPDKYSAIRLEIIRVSKDQVWYQTLYSEKSLHDEVFTNGTTSISVDYLPDGRCESPLDLDDCTPPFIVAHFFYADVNYAVYFYGSTALTDEHKQFLSSFTWGE